jgi:subtilisin family serine protease
MELDTIQMKPESWGLDRIDDITLPMNQQYHYEYDGSNVDVYILDTGLYFNHIDFSTIIDLTNNNNHHQRIVSCGYDAFANLISNDNESQQGLCYDTIGHGTHVTGIIGGLQNGVAKHTNLISVKIFDTNYGGQLSTLLAGLDYVFGQKLNQPNRSTIINISISGPRCTLLNLILSRFVNDANIVVIVSAGNDASDSCMKSPASAEIPVITVSAIDQHDTIPSYANYGSCTNIFAPGHAITSAWIRDRHDVVRLSGTSFAAPHVTGGMCNIFASFNK